MRSATPRCTHRSSSSQHGTIYAGYDSSPPQADQPKALCEHQQIRDYRPPASERLSSLLTEPDRAVQASHAVSTRRQVDRVVSESTADVEHVSGNRAECFQFPQPRLGLTDFPRDTGRRGRTLEHRLAAVDLLIRFQVGKERIWRRPVHLIQPTSGGRICGDPDDEYGGIEYGGLPVNCRIFVIMLRGKAVHCVVNADNLDASAAAADCSGELCGLACMVSRPTAEFHDRPQMNCRSADFVRYTETIAQRTPISGSC
jgi:hypothetical protein